MMTKIEEEIIQNILRSEHWEDNLSGLKWSPKLKDVVLLKHQMEIREWRSNEDLTLLKNTKTSSYAELIELNKNLQQRLIESSCAAVLRSQSDFRIKGNRLQQTRRLVSEQLGNILIILNPASHGPDRWIHII